MAKHYTAYERALSEHIGRRIEYRRKFLRLSQRKLAAQIGIESYKQFYRYESGEVVISSVRLVAVAKALGVSLDYFIQGFEQEPSHAITS